MNITSHPQNVSTSPRPVARTSAGALIHGAEQIRSLEQSKGIATADLRQVMTEVSGGSDAKGLWLRKDAYKPTEVAQVLFLCRSITSRVQSPQSARAMLMKVARLSPTHTRRSEEMISWKLRSFVPVAGEGTAILSKLNDRHRLVDVAHRS